MDVIFKIAGIMILIIIGLIILTAIINSWPDIVDSISGLFSDFTYEKEHKQKAEEKEFQNQILTILENKGRFDPKSKQQVYSDNKITIYENKNITWKAGNSMKDCKNYIETLYLSCSSELSKRLKASEKIYEQASRVITYLGENEEYQSGALFLYRDDRSSNITIYLNGHLIFSKTDFRDLSSLTAYRTGKWENDLSKLDLDAKKRKSEEEQEKSAAKIAKRQKCDTERFTNFSPIDE